MTAARWIALSDSDAPVDGTDGGAVLQRGTFVLELMLPLAGPAVLLHHATAGGAVGFSLFHDPARGLIVLHRQGKRLTRHDLPGAFRAEAGLVRVVFTWDVPAGQWWLVTDAMDGTARQVATGSDPLAWSVATMTGVCRDGQRHAAVLWYGMTTGDTPPAPRPWIGLRTPVDTPRGPVAAGLLRAGDVVLTEDHGPLPVVHVQHPHIPGRGAFAPILLRAPYFARSLDLLVSSEQPIGLGGTSVEYLFGEDRVLAPAGHLADGMAAYRDTRRPVITGVALDFGRSALITADGCTLMTRTATDARLPARLLHRFEVTPLIAMQAGSGLRPVA